MDIMNSHVSRSGVRMLVLAVVVPLIAVGMALVSSPAQAKWSTHTTVHNAKVQLCKVKAPAGWRVKLRLHNYKAKHAHKAVLFRERGKKQASISVVAKRGKFSPVRSLIWKKGDGLTTMLSEINGPGAGGGAGIGEIALCRA